MNLSALNRREEQLSYRAQIARRFLSKRTFLGAALGCLALVFVVYHRSLDFQFILDDHRFTADPRIQESGHVWDYFANFVWAQFNGGPPSFYRPVFLLWMRTNFLLSGSSPWGWHLLSIAKHAVVAALLGLLVWKLLRDSTAALVAATLFALHPAQTESVSWVTVPDPLMAAGILLSLFSFLRYLVPVSMGEQARGKKPRTPRAAATPANDRKWLAISIFAYFLALLAKETALVFPAVIFAVSLGSQPRERAERSRSAKDQGVGGRWALAFGKTAPFLLATGVYLLMRLSALGGKLGGATQHLAWSTIILSWPSILCFYLKAMLWPAKSYSFADPILVSSFSARGVLLPLLGLALAAAIVTAGFDWISKTAVSELDHEAYARFKTSQIAGALLLILPLVPALNLNALNPGDFLHGRYTYLPLAGLMLLVAAGWRMAKGPRIVFWCAACALAIGFSILTVEQEQQWESDATVFSIAHDLAPRNVPVARNLADTRVLLGLRLHEEGRCSEALPIFEQVTGEFPEDWYAWAGLGDCYVEQNDLIKGEDSLHRAVDISHDPGLTEHWQELRRHMGLSKSDREK